MFQETRKQGYPQNTYNIKHENVLIARTGYAVFADFGLVQFATQMHAAAGKCDARRYVTSEVLFPGLFGTSPVVVYARVGA